MYRRILKGVVLAAAAGTMVAAVAVVWRSIDQADTGRFVSLAARAVADTVHPGETLGTVARRHGVSAAPLTAALGVLGVDPAAVPVGTDVLFLVNPGDSSVAEISFRKSRNERIVARSAAGSWRALATPIGWHSSRAILGGRIDPAYRVIIDSSGIGPTLTGANRDELIARLADVFAWQVDFAREVSPDDRFRAVIDVDVSNDGQQELRIIRAVTLTLSGHRLEAFWFQPLRGPAGYYDGQGRSLRRPFLRAPLDFRRISSTFATMRLHPILPIIRAHRGVDYAAPLGTPVAAAGTGIVSIAGPSGEYGLMVELDHGGGVTTRYGHLSRLGPGVRVGQRVTQGTWIGSVGQSGLANAPHLHYEFRVGGIARDLRWLDVDPGPPISPALLNNFMAERDQLRAELGVPA
jgi:murein DD-endopeptidase MepM/ murein hydrolase activator NlpD